MIIGSESGAHNKKDVKTEDENYFFGVVHGILSRLIDVHLDYFIKFYNYC
jgi:hypothetical protein